MQRRLSVIWRCAGIAVFCALGGGEVGRREDGEYKIDFIDRYAYVSQIWELRTKGYTEIADWAYETHKRIK